MRFDASGVATGAPAAGSPAAGSPASAQLTDVLALGVSIRRHIEQADLEGAGELAAERHRQLVALFAQDIPDTAGDSLSYWLQEILREDQGLLQALAEVRGKMELELGATRRSARSAREYATVAEGHRS